MANITYTDKLNNSTSGLAANKKVSDDDMNEIKTVVNANAGLHTALQSQVDTLEGISGSVPLTYTFDSTVTESDPGAGRFRLNNVAPASATAIFISKTDNAFATSGLFGLISVGSYIYIKTRGDATGGALYIVASISDQTTWFKFGITLVDSDTLTNGDVCAIQFFIPAVAGSGDVATDAIWDAKGDIAGGTGSNTATVVSVGTNGQVLKANSTQTNGLEWEDVPCEIGLYVGALATDLTTGTAKETFRMPYSMTVTDVRISVPNTTAAKPTGANIIVDVNESGTTILSTKVSIDAGESTSRDAVTPPVISDSALAEDNEITIDIDQVGSTNAGQELFVQIIGHRVI